LATVTPVLKSTPPRLLCDATCAHREEFSGRTIVVARATSKFAPRHGLPIPGHRLLLLTAAMNPTRCWSSGPGSDGPRFPLYIAARDRAPRFLHRWRYGDCGSARAAASPKRPVLRDQHAPSSRSKRDFAALAATEIVSVRDSTSGSTILEPNKDDELLHDAQRASAGERRFRDRPTPTGRDYTVKGFQDVVRALPAARTRRAVIEGVFHCARVSKATTWLRHIAPAFERTVLHWMRTRCGETRRSVVARRRCRMPQPLHRRRHEDAPINGNTPRRKRRIYDLVVIAQQAASTRSAGATFKRPRGGDEDPRSWSL